MDSNDRLTKIADFTRTHLEEVYQKRKDRQRLDHFLAHADYRWQHTLRVAQYGKVIAEAESADIELVVIACLLHDIGWFETDVENHRDHGRIGSQIARPLLEQLDFQPDQVENICYSISTHVDVENPDTQEAKILSDADNIDRFGPYRILQWCYPEIMDYQNLTDKLRDRIKRLEHIRDEHLMFTQTGEQLIKEQLGLQIAFFRVFAGEKDLSILPQI